MESFSNSFVDTFLSDGMVISFKVECLVVWSLIIIPGLLWFRALSVLMAYPRELLPCHFLPLFLIGVQTSFFLFSFDVMVVADTLVDICSNIVMYGDVLCFSQ